MRRCIESIHRLTIIVALTAASLRTADGQPLRACCTVTAIDPRTGVVRARESASGNVFEFRARTPAAVAGLRVGHAVYANFARSQVSLDGRTVCCTVTTPPTPASSVREPSANTPAKGVEAPGAAIAATARTANLPRITYGEPMPAPARTFAMVKLTPVSKRTVTATVGGRQVSAQIEHLVGRQGIRSSGLPDGARRLLEMHVSKLPAGESHYYLVDLQLAAKWAATHPVPASIKPKEESSDHDSDCGDVSFNGIGDCFDDAAQAVKDEIERARKRAQDWWDESTGELADQWHEARSCFTDHTLPGPTTPVRFDIAPSMTVDLSKSGSKGSAQGTVAGAVTLGFPMRSDFQAKAAFLYIPCLPFAFRPKSVGADGNLTVGQRLAVDVTSTGSFDKTFTIPPTGGPQIPLYVIPIVIGDVPVAVLDVSAYIEGDVQVNADGKAEGKFAVASSHRSTFDFECSGAGCTGREKGTTAPTTTNESAQIEGQVSVKPGIFTALQLSFDYNVLQGRAGPEPYLLGVANGCAGVAVQSSGAASGATTNVALTADVDWGVDVRAEALAGGQRIGDRWQDTVMRVRHVWFRDLAPGGSSALLASVSGATQVGVSQPLGLKVRMPSCYPYTSQVTYRVTWSGGARPAPSPACQWQTGTGTCRFDPTKELSLTLTWPAAGSQSVSVQLVRDEHRTFSPAPAAERVDVTVTAAAAPGGEKQ